MVRTIQNKVKQSHTGAEGVDCGGVNPVDTNTQERW